MRSTLLLFLFAVSGCARLNAAFYYVDSVRGSDTHSGKSDSKAWRSLHKVNEYQFKPGDHILLKWGSQWKEQLAPVSSGDDGKPIVFDAYGQDAERHTGLPHIFGDQVHPDAVFLHNIQNVEVHHLEISNAGDGRAIRRGVYIFAENYGTACRIVLADLYIHDVVGTDTLKDNGGIIYRTLGDKVPTRFDGLLFERNIIWKTDRSGIAALSYNASRTHWFPSLHVVIRDNYVEDIGGDGIVPLGADGPLVEGNVARKCNQRSTGYNGGIWQWATDNAVFRLNETFETGGTRDGEGFDSDYNSRNTRFEFNYGHNNNGGFMLICTPVQRESETMIGNTGTVVRYNISRDNRNRLINLSGASDVLVEHNAFYVGGDGDVQMLVSEWKGWSHDASFRDNFFDVRGGALIFGHSTMAHPDGLYDIAPGWAPAQEIVYTRNRYVGNVVNPPEDYQPGMMRGEPTQSSEMNWDETFYDPSRPQDYPAYLKVHRAWMIALFERQFGPAIRAALQQR